VLRAQVQAFGSGLDLARYELNRKLCPRIESILSSDDDQGLGALFRPFLPETGAKP
jgi:hypothetical protein